MHVKRTWSLLSGSKGPQESIIQVKIQGFLEKMKADMEVCSGCYNVGNLA